MKINLDCVRHILLYLEDNLEYDQDKKDIQRHETITIIQLANALNEAKGYTEDEVFYAAEQLYQAGYISAKVSGGGMLGYDFFFIYDITYDGHTFLNNIRDNNIWSKIKEVAKATTNFSLPVIGAAAKTLWIKFMENPDSINTTIQNIQQFFKNS